MPAIPLPITTTRCTDRSKSKRAILLGEGREAVSGSSETEIGPLIRQQQAMRVFSARPRRSSVAASSSEISEMFCIPSTIAIVDGMQNISEISDDEAATLERLGLAENTRMACCCRIKGPISVSLDPETASRPSPSKIARLDFDRSVQRVVVIGNGIAGITAADYVRRNHPECAIDIVADEIHQLYNRMAITRLVYGRSAMQGLYLNPDSWCESRDITLWLNTRAKAIDRDEREVLLGTQ